MPPPSLGDGAARPDVENAFFGIRIEAAVNLLEAREYHQLDRTERLHKALEEQRGFLNAQLDPRLGVIDLRMRVDPSARTPISMALLGRVWANERGRAEALADERQRLLAASLPRHVSCAPIVDPGELAGWLSPFAHVGEVATITRREVIAAPQRPDAGVGYYFAVVPFNWTDTDWTMLYQGFAASPVPVCLSVALLPITLPPSYGQLLQRMSTTYARLAREDRVHGGVYYGERLIPPDAFAVDAEPIFADYARRYNGSGFVIRVLAAAESGFPPGLLEAIASSISPGDSLTTHLNNSRAASAYEIRRAIDEAGRRRAIADLEELDVQLLPGAAEIWKRADPPARPLATLASLGDARDAACAFRLPIAIDGTVPGFVVGKGAFGHEQSAEASGPSIRIGQLSQSGAELRVSLDSLSKHTLVAGMTGSGKTTTVLQILRQLWLDHRTPFLVIEPVNSDADDYRRLLSEPGFEDLVVITVGDESGLPLRFNPFEVPAGVQVGEHAANLLACFKAAFGLWEPLPSIYQDALNLTYLNAGILMSERGGPEIDPWPSVVEFLAAMRAVTSKLEYAGEVKHNIEAASVRRAEQLTTGPSASALVTNLANDIGALLARPTVLELKSLGAGDEQALMMGLLLNAITEHYQSARGASSGLAHVTVIEEAHRLLERPAGGAAQGDAQAKEKAAAAFANTLAENRKYGEGLLIAEQLPTKLVADAIKNTNLKIMHRLTAADERTYLGETMGLDEAQLRFATKITVGEGLVYSDELPEALHVTVSPGASGPLPSLSPVASPPFRACSACRAQCRYRGAALSLVRDPELVEGLQHEMRTIQRPDVEVGERNAAWTRLLARLRGRVSSFRALPSAEPELSDAAFCLLLHSLAIRRMNFAPTWATATAQRLAATAMEGT